MKVDGSVGSLLQGVSQQAPRERFNGQCTLQENMSSDAVNGLTRRPPTDLVGFLASTTSHVGWHNFQTRDGNKFLAMFVDGAAKVFNLNAEEQAVTIASGSSYLTNTDGFKFSTNDDDTTIVVNPAKTVAMDVSTIIYYNVPQLSTSAAAIFQVLGGAYGQTYTISVNGNFAGSYTPPDGTSPQDHAYTSTDFIAARLYEALTSTTPGTFHPGGPTSSQVITGICSGFVKGIAGDVFFLKSTVLPNTITVNVTDGAGGVNLKVCIDSVASVSELPRFAPHRYAVRVAENADQQKDLWFKFLAYGSEANTSPDAALFGYDGYWQETVAPLVNTNFNTATMPHKLTYNDPGFTFSVGSYVARKIGTDVSNPPPSFVGSNINDVSSFQGRTVFLSGSNVIMSRTNKLTDFWRGSASALVDTDPIDINSTVESSSMLACVQHNKDLAVFSPKAQFSVFGRTALTPINASLVLTTQFESELQAHPVGAGKNVFFTYNFGRYTGVREFFSQSSTDDNDSRPITQHVNKYIVGKATHLSASANYETLIVHTDAVQTDAYVYQYIWNDEKKLQSAWSSWLFKNNLVYSFFDEDVVYVVQRVGDAHYLLRMPLDVQDSDGVGYPIHLDQRFDVFDCHLSFVLPFDYLADNGELVVVQGTDCPTPGLTVAVDSIDAVVGVGQVVTLKKNMLGGDVIVGTRYLSRYMPTMPSVKDANGVAMGTSKMRARSFLVSLDQTGEISGRVRSKHGDGPEVSFNARIVGDVDNVVGEQPLSDGHFDLPFRQNVNDAEIELYSDSHLPMTLSNIEYVGQYNKRGRRIANQGDKQ